MKGEPMEKQQAIDLLDNLIGMVEDNQDNDYDTAFRIAIDALRQPEPCGDKSYTLWKESYEELKRRMDELTSCSDIISRQQALDAIYESANDLQDVLIPAYYRDLIKELPSAQPEPSIPLSWIEKYIEWLKSLDNEFVNLAAAHISVMVKKWRREQNETD